MSVGLLFFVAAGLHAQAAQQAPPVQAAKPKMKIGTRVGLPERSGGYDDGGRRDPFASLIVEKAPVAVAASDPAAARAKGLAGVAIVDVKIKGIIASGQTLLAIISGPDGASYLAHTNDRLHDGVVRRIDRDAVVFLAKVPDGTGRIVSREVRIGLRPGMGDGR
jgi:Tfp pilus assembly protein PilP